MLLLLLGGQRERRSRDGKRRRGKAGTTTATVGVEDTMLFEGNIEVMSSGLVLRLPAVDTVDQLGDVGEVFVLTECVVTVTLLVDGRRCRLCGDGHGDGTDETDGTDWTGGMASDKVG